MAASRRVVITGLGLLTPIGTSPQTFWQSLMGGKSGVRPIKSFDTSGLPVRFAGEISNFDAKDYVDKKDRRSLKVMARPIQMGVSAAQLALNEGKVDKSKLDPTRFGVEFGHGLIASELPELADAARAGVNCQPGRVDMEKWGAESIHAIQPLWMLKYLPNMPACHVSIIHDAQGPNNSITESDAASALALGEATRILQRDGADFFLVGGSESKLNPMSLVRQCLFEQMSRRNETPEQACRPFDRDRDGLVVGEGAAVMVVEELAHAEKRGARILAEIAGFGSAFDARLNGDGLARAIQAALKEAGISPAEVDHVIAHGLAAPQVDIREARGLAKVFGDLPRPVPVFAAKGFWGNLGAASGLVELSVSLLALQHGVLPGSINHDKPDAECPIQVNTAPRAIEKPYAVKVAFTQQGQCAAVVVRKWN